MSEWITNTKTTPGCPEHLKGVLIEADFGFYNPHQHADCWYLSWDTKWATYPIKRYRILDAEQTPMKVGEGSSANGEAPNMGCKDKGGKGGGKKR